MGVNLRTNIAGQTVTASTKRAPAVTSGKRGEPVTHLATLRCTPLDPLDPETAQRLGLQTPHTLRQTFTDGSSDIMAGDVLVVSARDYPIRSVAAWDWRGVTYSHLVVEDLRR